MTIRILAELPKQIEFKNLSQHWDKWKKETDGKESQDFKKPHTILKLKFIGIPRHLRYIRYYSTT